MARSKFTCTICGLDKNLRQLSEESYARAGTRSARAVLQNGYDTVCKSCEREITRKEERIRSDAHTYREFYGYSGIDLPEATLDWLAQNY